MHTTKTWQESALDEKDAHPEIARRHSGCNVHRKQDGPSGAHGILASIFTAGAERLVDEVPDGQDGRHQDGRNLDDRS